MYDENTILHNLIPVGIVLLIVVAAIALSKAFGPNKDGLENY